MSRKARIENVLQNINWAPGLDQGLKGIGGPKIFFHFYYTKTCKKYEILTISHIPVISQWSITCTIPLIESDTKTQTKAIQDSRTEIEFHDKCQASCYRKGPLDISYMLAFRNCMS